MFTSNPLLLVTSAIANFHGLQLDTSEEDQGQQQKVHSSAGSKHIVAWVGTRPCQVPACLPVSRLCAWPVLPLSPGTFVGRLRLARSLSLTAPTPSSSFQPPLFGHLGGVLALKRPRGADGSWQSPGMGMGGTLWLHGFAFWGGSYEEGDIGWWI